MNVFVKSIYQVATGSVKTFKIYPAAIASAVGFAIVTFIRIQLNWPFQEAYNFLFNCLHWSFALGAIFSLAAITAANSRFNDKRSFIIANVVGLGAAVATFLLLYLFGSSDLGVDSYNYARVTDIAAARVGVVMLISFIAFIVLAGYPKDRSDFSQSFFMTHKAFFIALIYGVVIMGGTSGVAGAVQVLIYQGMSEKVYQYIATIVGFLAFTIFVGYFPDFRKGVEDEKREIAQKQPRFVEVLFDYIMIPIVMAMTVVLFIWAWKTIATSSGYSFAQLSGIATSYAIAGIWLHIMVTSHETALSKLYKKAYPIAALVILGFEAWALIAQLNKYGLKMDEYTFIIIWIIAVAAAILLLIIKSKAHVIIAITTCALAIFGVLPVVGYLDLPVSSQIYRVEKLLISQNMLQDNKLIPAAKEPELWVRESITDGVGYLSYVEGAKLPAWFDKKLAGSGTFKDKFGFEQAWPKSDVNQPDGQQAISLMLPSGAIDISEYRWVVKFTEFKEGPNAKTEIKGSRGTYQIDWSVNQQNNIPTIKILLNGKVIVEQDMKEYADKIIKSFSPGKSSYTEASLKDMSFKIETSEIVALLVFKNININVDVQNDFINYWFDLSDVYMKEKP